MNHYLKSVLCAVAAVSILLVVHRPAEAATCTQFHNYTTNDTVTAANLNGNITNLVTCGNSVDNTQIGSSGLFASQIKPTSTANATFGGTQNYTFPATLILNASSNGCSSSAVCLFNDNAGTNGLAFNVPTSSSNGYQFEVAGVKVAQITADGLGYFTPHSQTTPAPAAPTYTHTGAAAANTLHTVVDTFQPTFSGNCSTNTFCSLSGNSVTFTNAAVFTSATSYTCAVSTGLTKSIAIVQNNSASSLLFYLWNQSGGTFLNANTADFEYICTGT